MRLLLRLLERCHPESVNAATMSLTGLLGVAHALDCNVLMTACDTWLMPQLISPMAASVLPIIRGIDNQAAAMCESWQQSRDTWA